MQSVPLATILCLLLPVCLAAQHRPPHAMRSSASAPSGPEKELFDSANRERTAEDLPPLQWDPALAAAARKHTLRMSEEKLIDHQYSGEDSLADRTANAGAHFNVVAENIAVGENAESIHMAWMHSPGHRGNILDPQLTAIGIATVKSRGYMFATQDFSRAAEALTIDEQEKRVAALLASSGFKGAIASEDARKTCALSDGYSGKLHSFLRFETADLTKFPDNVADRLGSIHSRSAAVGACPAKGASGFTRYRVAILFL